MELWQILLMIGCVVVGAVIGILIGYKYRRDVAEAKVEKAERWLAPQKKLTK